MNWPRRSAKRPGRYARTLRRPSQHFSPPNFPQPIVKVLQDFQADAELVPVSAIDPRMSELDDWHLLLALHHHEQPWDGLITTDSSILFQPMELAVLIQMRLTLVLRSKPVTTP